MNDRALNYALEASSGLGIFAVVDNEGFQLSVHILSQVLAQGVQVDIARPHHR